MSRAGLAALCLAIPVLLPGFAGAQDAPTPYNAPPNGVLHAASGDARTSAGEAKISHASAKGIGRVNHDQPSSAGVIAPEIVRAYEQAARVAGHARAKAVAKHRIPFAERRNRSTGRRAEGRIGEKRLIPVSAAVRTRQIRSRAHASATGTQPKPAELLSTRPDPLDRPQESPASTMRDAWKLLAYLAPVLLLVLLAIRGLKALYTKQGKLGSFSNSLAGGLTLFTARKTAGSSIRVLESVPVGTVGLHLVEVRGKLLLLGTSGGNVHLLTELEVPPFGAVLKEAGEGLDPSGEATVAAVVHEIDNDLRQAKDAVLESAARMHGWRPGTN